MRKLRKGRARATGGKIPKRRTHRMRHWQNWCVLGDEVFCGGLEWGSNTQHTKHVQQAIVVAGCTHTHTHTHTTHTLKVDHNRFWNLNFAVCTTMNNNNTWTVFWDNLIYTGEYYKSSLFLIKQWMNWLIDWWADWLIDWLKANSPAKHTGSSQGLLLTSFDILLEVNGQNEIHTWCFTPGQLRRVISGQSSNRFTFQTSTYTPVPLKMDPLF